MITYVVITVMVLAICFLGMSIGLIFRNKTFTSCGRAAQQFDSERIQCAACGETVGQEKGNCKRTKTSPISAS